MRADGAGVAIFAVYMKKGTAIFPGWLFPFVYCVAGVDAYAFFTLGGLTVTFYAAQLLRGG